MARENMGTNIDSGVVASVAAGMNRNFMEATRAAWFGPMQPMQPVVPAQQAESVAGRQFDYPVGYNQRTQTRSGESVSFAEMRGLADGYDLMRLVIESRKDQMGKLRWTVKPKDENAKPDARCDALKAFFASPDKEHTWDEWLRMLLEDLLVIDAPAIYIRPTIGGQPYALEPVDGATIKRVLDERGRTPLPPDPAYQQILKGVPSSNYTTKELIYRPRNVRTHKVYGYSPVEQIIMSVNIALRRQLHQLQFYTEGSTPDMIFAVPENWTSEQTKQFKAWWDATLAGNTAARRGTMFIPAGANPINTKDASLKDEFDEWLARIVCYAFSVSPQSFVKEMNRATAETAVDQAEAEGLQPIMQWVKSLMDSIITIHFGFADLEFGWETGVKELPPEKQAAVHKLYLDGQVITPDEVRADLGRDPLTPEEREKAWPKPPAPTPPNGEPAAKPNDGKGGKATGAEAVAKAKKSLPSTESEGQLRKHEASCTSASCKCSEKWETM